MRARPERDSLANQKARTANDIVDTRADSECVSTRERERQRDGWIRESEEKERVGSCSLGSLCSHTLWPRH